MREEIDAVEGTIDSKRTAEPAGPAAEIAGALGRAPVLHDRNPLYRLERTHEHAGSLAVGLTR